MPTAELVKDEKKWEESDFAASRAADIPEGKEWVCGQQCFICGRFFEKPVVWSMTAEGMWVCSSCGAKHAPKIQRELDWLNKVLAEDKLAVEGAETLTLSKFPPESFAIRGVASHERITNGHCEVCGGHEIACIKGVTLVTNRDGLGKPTLRFDRPVCRNCGCLCAPELQALLDAQENEGGA